MTIWAKIGTMPAAYYKALHKRKKPTERDWLTLRETFGGRKGVRVRVTHVKEIDGITLYYVERM